MANPLSKSPIVANLLSNCLGVVVGSRIQTTPRALSSVLGDVVEDLLARMQVGLLIDALDVRVHGVRGELQLLATRAWVWPSA